MSQTLIIAHKLYLTWKIALIYSLLQDSKYQQGQCENLRLEWNYHERDSVHISVSSDQPQFARKSGLPSSGNRSLFSRCGVTGTNGKGYQWRHYQRALIWKSIVSENKSCPTHALWSVSVGFRNETALVLCDLTTLCVRFTTGLHLC